jgi:hypothetical protein
VGSFARERQEGKHPAVCGFDMRKILMALGVDLL